MHVMTPEQIFANLRGLGDIDNQLDGKLRKSTTSVVGLEVVRQDLEPTLRLAANLMTPLRNRFQRIRGEGNAHAYYKLVSNPGTTVTGARFIGTDPIGALFPKGGLPNSVDPQYQYVARPYANIGDVLTVAWQDIAQDRSFIDIKSQQRYIKMINTGLCEEYFIINGDSDATNGLAFDGLIKQITTDGFNIVDLSPNGGQPLKFSIISQLIFQISRFGGTTRALVMSYAMKQAITELIGINYYGIRQTTPNADGRISGGVQVDRWNFGNGPVDLIADQYMLPDPITGLEQIIFLDDETADQKNTGSAVMMVDVDPVHYAELASIATSDRGIVYETCMLQVGITQFNGLMKGLNLAIPGSV